MTDETDLSAKHTTDKDAPIWCSTCGDTTFYNPAIRWEIKDEQRRIGICSLCADVLDKEYLVLPDKSEDGYASFN